MPGAGGSSTRKGLQAGKRAGGENGFLRFLRDSRIFASAIHEVLDVKLLGEASPSPLTPAQFQVLKLMSFNGHHQVGDMADLLGVSPPAATKNIDRLERLGLVARTPSKGNRRAGAEVQRTRRAPERRRRPGGIMSCQPTPGSPHWSVG